METIEHFAHISLVARLLGREHLLSREEVGRLQQLRETYGIVAPAPVCQDEPSNEEPDCQVLQAPSAPGERLVPDTSVGTGRVAVGNSGEIQLTYAELTTLIEGAVRHLTARTMA
jgi:L-fuculose-phosphate aldolase